MKMQRRQRGVAVVTALLLTTLAISIVASLFWQQQVQVRSMENQRLQLQTQWIERGALDWAALVLQQDAQDNQWTSLDQIWATPLAETRLDQYIERERVQGESYDATLSGTMVDASARYNLINLASGGAPDKPQVEVFQRLLKNLQIDPDLAARTAQFVAASQGLAVVDKGEVSGGGDGQPAPTQKPATVMKLVQLDDLLAVPGWTPALVEKLRPFAIVLPANTPVNVNTAPAEVLSALAPGLSLMTANSLVARRKQAPYKDAVQFANEALQGQGNELPVPVTVKSDWFLVESHIKLDRASLNVEALVSRKSNPALRQLGPHVVWIRQI